MKAHTNVQIIKQDGEPAFAVIPYQEYLELTHTGDDQVYLPNEVVGLCIEQDLSLIAAWRKYRKMSQADLAGKMGISQAAVAQMEHKSVTPRSKTLEKVAQALGISVEQLVE